MIWIIGAILYLAVGFFFQMPKDFNIFVKLFLRIFWFPVLLFMLIVLRFGKGSIL